MIHHQISNFRLREHCSHLVELILVLVSSIVKSSALEKLQCSVRRSIFHQMGIDSAPSATGVRARVRAELTKEIRQVARRQLAETGPAALSLRAVAREVGMVSSAVYRYYPSRDELLTALIIDAYDAVGRAAEEADAGCRRADLFGRAMATARGIRSWAKANPQEYALLYGSPVPGYAAPADTIDPAARVALVMTGILVDGVASGVLVSEPIKTTRVVRSDLGRLRAEVAAGVPDSVLSAGLLAWSSVFGSITFELFGHFDGVISDADGFFELQMASAHCFLRSGP